MILRVGWVTGCSRGSMWGPWGSPSGAQWGPLGALGSSWGLSSCDCRRVFPSVFWSAAFTLGRGRFSSEVMSFPTFFLWKIVVLRIHAQSARRYSISKRDFVTFFPEMTTRGSSAGRAESDGPVGISEVPGRMLRKRDPLPGRAWRCLVKIHPFPQFAPKREPPGVPGEAAGEAVWRKGQNSSALSVSQMAS